MLHSELVRELDRELGELDRVFGTTCVCLPLSVTKENVLGAWFNEPYTTVKWSDGTTTTVKCGDDDEYNKATGFLLCCAKRLFGGGRYLDVMRKLGIDIDGKAE